MVKRLSILFVLCLICFACAHAETLLLRTGARVNGVIVFQNEEVIVIRDAEGARFQYPRAEVAAVLPDEEEISTTQDVEAPVEEARVSKKASVLLEIAGGAAVIPNEATGGAVSADLIVGSHRIAGRHLLIGGGLGYHGLFFGAQRYNFLPIQVVLRMPFTETKHAPAFGASLGYGIALSKDFTGGIYAGIDFGYRCQINPKTAVSVAGFVQFQQAQIATVETIDGNEYKNRTGRNFLTPGIKLALFF